MQTWTVLRDGEVVADNLDKAAAEQLLDWLEAHGHQAECRLSPPVPPAKPAAPGTPPKAKPKQDVTK